MYDERRSITLTGNNQVNNREVKERENTPLYCKLAAHLRLSIHPDRSTQGNTYGRMHSATQPHTKTRTPRANLLNVICKLLPVLKSKSLPFNYPAKFVRLAAADKACNNMVMENNCSNLVLYPPDNWTMSRTGNMFQWGKFLFVHLLVRYITIYLRWDAFQ